MRFRFIILLLLVSCSSNTFQSVLHPSGPVAYDLKNLTWFLIILSSFIFFVVLALIVIALKKKDIKKNSFIPGNKFILISGVVIPSFILLGMLIYSLETTVRVRGLNQSENGIKIKVIGHQWWWEVQYPDYQIVTANEIYIPAGVPVKVELSSADVIHSFWVPNVHGKMDMIPGVTTLLTFVADRPGEYRGQCAEFCGLQHALMAFPLKVLEEKEFNNWLARQRQPVATSLDSQAARGKKVFFEAACNACHVVKGTEANGIAGPDLTRIASRETLGAGIVPNNRNNLARWIINSQEIKPYNRMPPTKLVQEDLDALLIYLETLK